MIQHFPIQLFANGGILSKHPGTANKSFPFSQMCNTKLVQYRYFWHE